MAEIIWMKIGCFSEAHDGCKDTHGAFIAKSLSSIMITIDLARF